MTDYEIAAVLAERVAILGLTPLRFGAESGRVWVAVSAHAKSYGATFVAACLAWLEAHPAPVEGA